MKSSLKSLLLETYQCVHKSKLILHVNVFILDLNWQFHPQPLTPVISHKDLCVPYEYQKTATQTLSLIKSAIIWLNGHMNLFCFSHTSYVHLMGAAVSLWSLGRPIGEQIERDILTNQVLRITENTRNFEKTGWKWIIR